MNNESFFTIYVIFVNKKWLVLHGVQNVFLKRFNTVKVDYMLFDFKESLGTISSKKYKNTY